MKLLAIFIILACGSNLGSAAERDAAITENELIRRTQELYDAVVPGDQAPWKKYFTDDSIFADEKGRTMDKPKLIADITPLPAGYSGAIKHEPLSPMGIACSSKEMERKSNYFRKHLSFSFAKVSKAESCFVMIRTEKSTHLSTGEITKTSSGARLLTNRL